MLCLVMHQLHDWYSEKPKIKHFHEYFPFHCLLRQIETLNCIVLKVYLLNRNKHVIQFICILESQVVECSSNGELLYTKILEVNLFAFAYRLFHFYLLLGNQD